MLDQQEDTPQINGVLIPLIFPTTAFCELPPRSKFCAWRLLAPSYLSSKTNLDVTITDTRSVQFRGRRYVLLEHSVEMIQNDSGEVDMLFWHLACQRPVTRFLLTVLCYDPGNIKDILKELFYEYLHFTATGIFLLPSSVRNLLGGRLVLVNLTALTHYRLKLTPYTAGLRPVSGKSDVEAGLGAKDSSLESLRFEMFAFKIVASLAVLLVAAVNASPADVAARQEQGFACNANGTVYSQWKSWWPALPRLNVASKGDI
ncbi:hypothetical protein C8R44DRAFT_749283 [Mycena epipterygia]|nr:hypothetical protein C8R44DRAFT_749283 [Mycena epipterygia]